MPLKFIIFAGGNLSEFNVVFYLIKIAICNLDSTLTALVFGSFATLAISSFTLIMTDIKFYFNHDGYQVLLKNVTWPWRIMRRYIIG